MKKIINDEWVECTEKDLVLGDIYKFEVGGKVVDGKLVGNGWQQQTYVPVTERVIRVISTGSMQRRFTIEEEVFITSDPAATVIKSRLLNASYCNLDYQDTIEGITYICGVLKAGNIITDETARIAELLIDGTPEESI